MEFRIGHAVHQKFKINFQFWILTLVFNSAFKGLTTLTDGSRFCMPKGSMNNELKGRYVKYGYGVLIIKNWKNRSK